MDILKTLITLTTIIFLSNPALAQNSESKPSVDNRSSVYVECDSSNSQWFCTIFTFSFVEDTSWSVSNGVITNADEYSAAGNCTADLTAYVNANVTFSDGTQTTAGSSFKCRSD